MVSFGVGPVLYMVAGRMTKGLSLALPSGLWALLTYYSLFSFPVVQGGSMVGPLLLREKGGDGGGEKADQIILLIGFPVS